MIKIFLKILPSLLKILCSASTQCTQNNCAFPNNCLTNKFNFKNFNIYA
jgi:hypothetical protein